MKRIGWSRFTRSAEVSVSHAAPRGEDTPRPDPPTLTVPAEAALEVLAWFWTDVYDGAPDGGGVPAGIGELEDAVCDALGVPSCPRTRRETIDALIAEAT